MILLKELSTYCNTLLDISSIKDYCPNGLQVEGRPRIKKIVSAVTAGQACIDAAVQAEADALLVHHGFFWKNENPCVTGIKKRRLAALLKADLSLLVYHLPLDSHPVYGNNAQLGRVLDFPPGTPLVEEPLVLCANLPKPVTAEAMGERIVGALGRRALHIAGSTRAMKRIAWCSGAAQGFIEQVARGGADAYISGEISESTTHIAREYGIHYYAAGHHATERYGVQALGTHLSKKFDIHHEFIEIDNPV